MAVGIQTITLASLRDLIKIEARVKGSDNLDSWITALINELLLDFCFQKKYSELLLTNVPTVTVATQESYNLPSNFNFMNLVRYQTAAGNLRTLLPRNENVEMVGVKGLPRFYQITGLTFKIMPYVDVPANDSILLDYYKYPDPLVVDADIIPIPRLIAPIKQKAIYRTHVYNNTLQQAAALKGDSAEAETRSHSPKG